MAAVVCVGGVGGWDWVCIGACAGSGGREIMCSCGID